MATSGTLTTSSTLSGTLAGTGTLSGTLAGTGTLSGTIAGVVGPTGAAATIEVGTVETLAEGEDAYVTNSGTENAAILDFGIPVGATGATGPQGEQGNSIDYVELASGTGAAGTTDTYNVVLETGDIAGTFDVYNGADGTGTVGTATPLMDGTAAVGSSTAFAREDHVHPVDTSRASASDMTAAQSDISDLEDLAGSSTLTTTAQTLTGAINELDADIAALGSDDIANDSSNVSGSTVTDAIDALQASIASCISGKTVSIIGDSISTWDETGYKYDSYAMYYPTNDIADITSVDDTWWKQALDASGATLEVNASYSGSRVTNTHATAPSFYDRCTTTILGDPETILVALGTNDSGNSISIGDFDFDTTYTSLSEATFATAYVKGIKALQTLYPNSQIICVILSMGKSYARAIMRIATTLGCQYAICAGYEKGYGSHPNAHGMRQIASAVLSLNPWDGSMSSVEMYCPTLYVNAEDGIGVINPAFETGTAPSSTTTHGYYFKDRSDTVMASLVFQYTTAKTSRLRMRVMNSDSGSAVSNALDMLVDQNGNMSVAVTDAAAWRKALGLTYEAGDTYTVKSLACWGNITQSTTIVWAYLTPPKSLENISSVTVTSCKGHIRGISGYLDSLSGSNDLNDGTTYTTTAEIISGNTVRLVITKSSAWTNVTNNTPTMALLNLTLTFA